MKILECSSKGDKRFSDLHAEISVYGVLDSIRNHYHLSRASFFKNIFEPQKTKDLNEGEGDFFVVNGIRFPEEYLTQYYKLLWVKYLDSNQALVSFASEFDEFHDVFKDKRLNSPSDVLKQYVKEGRNSIMKECQSFNQILQSGGFVVQVTGDLLKSNANIIGHQTNCLGVMGAGIATSIKKLYPEIFKPYQKLCLSNDKSNRLLGECQLVETNTEGRYVANLFGQHSTSAKSQQTEYDSLEKALINLKNIAKEKNLSVGLPWQLGSRLGGGDWNEVKKRIEKAFWDYPVTIYKLPGL